MEATIKNNGDLFINNSDYTRTRYNTEPNSGGFRTYIEDLGLIWNDFNNNNNEVKIGNNLNYYDNKLLQIKEREYKDLTKAQFNKMVSDGLINIAVLSNEIIEVKNNILDGSEVGYEEVYSLMKADINLTDIASLLGVKKKSIDDKAEKIEKKLREDVVILVNDGNTDIEIAQKLGWKVTKIKDKITEINNINPIQIEIDNINARLNKLDDYHKKLIKPVLNNLNTIDLELVSISNDLVLIGKGVIQSGDADLIKNYDLLVVYKDSIFDVNMKYLLWGSGNDEYDIALRLNISILMARELIKKLNNFIINDFINLHKQGLSNFDISKMIDVKESVIKRINIKL